MLINIKDQSGDIILSTGHIINKTEIYSVNDINDIINRHKSLYKHHTIGLSDICEYLLNIKRGYT